MEVFFAEWTKKSIHCSELGGVHYIEVHLQQKSIGGTETRVQIEGVHYIEVFIKGGFTVMSDKEQDKWIPINPEQVNYLFIH